MVHVLVTESYLEDIADAIRSKNGSEDTYTPSEMAQAISGIHTADELVLVQKTVNVNGQYNASDDSADGYSGVSVNVPNSYSASDEGKVVSNGDLVAQTTKQITANGTHDTTANNSVVVDVPNSYAAADEGKVVSGGALVGQTSRNVTVNGTYDTTNNNEVVVNVPTEGGGSSNPIPPDYQGRSYAFIGTNGDFYTYTTNGNYMNFYQLDKDKTYAVFIGINVSNRLRIHFYSNKSFSDFEQYVLNAESQDIVYSADSNITGTNELNGNDLMRRFIITPIADGELVIMTSSSASSTQYIAYCVEL